MALVFYRKPTQKIQATPLIGDVFVQEFIDTKVASNKTLPAFGTAHPNTALWPNHKFAAAGEPDEEGIQAIWYVADFATQQAYNWQVSDTGEWPAIVQNFVILRSAYDPTPATPATTYPVPSLAAIDTTGYQLTGTRQIRIGDPKLDSLYVAVETIREKIDAGISGQELDLDTNTLRSYTKLKVAAGTAGSVVNGTGGFSEVVPLNTLWSIKNTRQAAGLAGNAAGGVSTRNPYNIVVNYYWPPVLNYIDIGAIPDTAGGIGQLFYRPVYYGEAYNGPCLAEVTETWTLAEPTVAAPTPMLPLPIVFDGAMLRISIPASLHAAQTIWESTGGTDTLGPYQLSRTYPATTGYTAWPATIVASIDVRPGVSGGFLTRVVTVSRPSSLAVANDLVLTLTDTLDSLSYSWAISNLTGTVQDYFLSVSEDPNMGFGLIMNNVDYNTATTGGINIPYDATGAPTRGVPYYARVKAVVSIGGVPTNFYSNIVAAVIQPSPRMRVSHSGGTYLAFNTAPSTVSFGTTIEVAGGTTVIVFTIHAVGEFDLEDLALAISGDHAADYTVSAALGATTVTAGGTTTFSITFNPSATGVRTAQLSIANNTPQTTTQPFLVNFSGTGVAPEIQVEQPASTILTDGADTIDYGGLDVSGGTLEKTFTVKNVGTSNLTSLVVSIDGAASADYTLTTALGATTVAPAGSTTFGVTFNPSAAGTRAAAIHIASNDGDENPFDISVTGEGLVPEITMTDPSFNPLTSGVSDVSYGTGLSAGLPFNSGTFTIGNTGGVNLTVSSPGFASEVNCTLGNNTNPSSPVAASGSTTFDFNITPTASGAFSATVSLTNNDGDENPFTFTISGTAA